MKPQQKMSALQQFDKDEQFMRLVRRESDVDLVVAALEIARDGQPELDFEPTKDARLIFVSALQRKVGTKHPTADYIARKV